MAHFLGRLQTFLFGAAIGRAASDAVTPVLEPVKQQAWLDNQNKVLDPGTAAEAVAQGAIRLSEAQHDANRSGLSNNRFGVLWRLAQHVPGVSEARTMRRRTQADGTGRLITPEQLHHVYAKAQIEPQFWPALDALLVEILTPDELAAAIHRGLVPDPGLLQGEQPAPPFKIDAYPVYPIDALQEAAGSGYNRDRLGVKVGLQGLPMGPHEAAQALFRGIITHGDYIRAFNTSNSRNEWAQAVLDQTRQIPTSRDFMENALRGHHDFDWAAQQAERHGMSREDAFLIYQNQGRPLNLHQISQALAWGAKYNPGPGDDPDPWQQAVLLGAVRPEYYELQHSLKYIVPGAFAIRQLAESGVWDEAKTAARLKQAGWIPEDADQVAFAWTQPAAAAANPFVGRAQTQLWAAIFNDYVRDRKIDRTAAGNLLAPLIPQARPRNQVLDMWTTVRDLTAPPAQTPEDPLISKADNQLWTAIHKAYVKDAKIDYATADSYLTNLSPDPIVRAVVLERWTTEMNLGGRTGPPA
jgi:hypothetical protein